MTSLVLVVDDEAPVRFTLRAILEDAGLGVEEAGDGAAARLLGIGRVTLIEKLKRHGLK